ncbi:MAG: YaaL family protein [Firmicutes bacterium]|jgi:hypothetical protein|nr:YaaL family protein [Bacillota bacterium]
MAKFWSYLLEVLSNQFIVDDAGARSKRAPELDLQEAVERARIDWLQARSYFDNVTDPDLIDHAIFCVKAAERKYVYLLKKAQSEGLNMSSPMTAEKGLISKLP